MNPTERFVEIVGGPSEGIGLDEAASLIAAHDHAGVDVQAQARALDDLASGFDGTIEGLVNHLFGTCGFAGDRSRYYDPANSFLDRVLERRTGIPITLAVVMVEVGRRKGVELSGVSMPGHFLVCHDRGGSIDFYDPFDGGRMLDAEACRDLFHAVCGDGAKFDISYLEPVGPKQILSRMLANLRELYAAAGALESLCWVLSLRAAIPGSPASDLAELAAAQARLGRFVEAAAILDRLSSTETGALGDLARHQARQLRASLN